MEVQSHHCLGRFGGNYTYLREVRASRFEFFSRFTKLDLEYGELVIDASFIFNGRGFVESAFQISTSTVKLLRLTAELNREYSLPVPPAKPAPSHGPITFKPALR